jgi:uncharacterized protein (TIGR03000 family)
MTLRNLLYGSLLALLLAICLADTARGQAFYAGSVTNRYGIGPGYNFGTYGPYATRPFGYTNSLSTSSFYFSPSLSFPNTSQYYIPGRHPLQYSGSLYPPVGTGYGLNAGAPLYGPGYPANTGQNQTTNIYNAPVGSNSPNVNLSLNRPGTTAYQANYPPLITPINPPAVNAAPQTADVEVRVPSADAQIWFGGVQTRQTGLVRQFVSPPLEPGKDYKYHVRIQWNGNGQSQEQTRTIQVRAGQLVQVDFTRPENQ